MRPALFLLLVLLAPAAASADAIVDHYYTTGVLEFGFSNAHQIGWGPYGLSTDARVFTDDFDISATGYEMSSGAFIRQELTSNAAGEVVQSKYYYEPGTLIIDYRLRSMANDEIGRAHV